MERGEGDIIAASLTIDDERRGLIAFSDAYLQSGDLIVGRAGEVSDVQGSQALRGREVWAQKGSPAWAQLEAIADREGLILKEAPAQLEIDDVLDQIASGRFDLAAVDANLFNMHRSWRDEVETAFSLGMNNQIAWGTRPDDAALREAVNDYLAVQTENGFINVLKQKYFSEDKQLAEYALTKTGVTRKLSPFDEVFREYAGAA